MKKLLNEIFSDSQKENSFLEGTMRVLSEFEGFSGDEKKQREGARMILQAIKTSRVVDSDVGERYASVSPNFT